MTGRRPGRRFSVSAVLLLWAIAGPVPAGQPASPAMEGAGAGRPGAEPTGRETAPRSLPPGTVFRDCAVCPEMVVVPAGSFLMGSLPDEKHRIKWEDPRRRVTIPRPLAVGRYEVTFAEWDACLADGGCAGHRPFDWYWGRGRRPVTNVSWEDAKAYLRWLTQRTGRPYRLLSEAEWEYAARAGTTGPYHFGTTISTDLANYNGSYWHNPDGPAAYRRKTVPVGSFPPNAFGLHDMHGNLWEWVEDCLHDSYLGAPADGSAWIAGGRCSSRALRGGSWYSGDHRVRSANRLFLALDNRSHANGIRVARDLGR